MFDVYMPALYYGLVAFGAVALLAALFTGPIKRKMAEVEKHSSGHNAVH